MAGRGDARAPPRARFARSGYRSGLRSARRRGPWRESTAPDCAGTGRSDRRPAPAPERRTPARGWRWMRGRGGCASPRQTRSLDLQDFLFFALRCLVDLLHEAVRHLLDLVERALLFVLGDLLVLEELLDGLVTVTPDVADAHPVIFGRGMQFLDEVLAALLRQRGNGKTDRLAVIGRVQPQIGGADGLLDGADLRHIPGLDRDEGRLGDVQIGKLIERRGSTVVVHPDVVQEAQRSPARANGGHFVLQVRHGLFHARSQVRLDVLDRGEGMTAGGCLWFGFHRQYLRRSRGGSVNHGADGLAPRHTHYISCCIQIENNNGEPVVAAHGDGCGIHYAEALGENLEVGDFPVHPGVRKLQGIFIVNTVDARRLGDDIRLDLERAEGGRGIGGEIGIRRSGREDDDAALLEMPDGAAADVRLGHLAHLDGAQHAGGNPDLFDRVGKRQRVDHGGQHAHMIGGDAVHVARSGGHSAEDVAAADHDTNLHARAGYIGHFAGQVLHPRGVNAEGRAAGQHLAAEFEQDALVVRHLLRDRFERRVFAAGFRRRHIPDLEADKAGHRDILAELGDLGFHELLDGERGFLDERLLQQTNFLVELGQTALHDAVENLVRLPFVAGAVARDFLFLLEDFGRHFFAAQIARIGRGDVHRDIVHQLFEIIGARDEVGFAVDLNHHAELAAGMDVAADETLFGGPRRLLPGRRDTLFAQVNLGLGDVAVGGLQRFLALHHPRAGALAEILN